jgi:hypothetical protein
MKKLKSEPNQKNVDEVLRRVDCLERYAKLIKDIKDEDAEYKIKSMLVDFYHEFKMRL